MTWSVRRAAAAATARMRQRAEPGDDRGDREPCPLCDGTGAAAFQVRGNHIFECGTCGHRYAVVASADGHTERVYGTDYFEGAAGGYGDYCSEAATLRARGQAYADILAAHRPPGSVLDVGCAAGFVLQGLEDRGWTAVGVEPNQHMAERARAIGAEVQVGTLETIWLDEPVDVVCMLQVLAHFVDIKIALDAAADLTAPGGMWLVETWNRESCVARLFGRFWHEYNPPSVLHWFTPESLAALCATRGFVPVAQGRPVKRISFENIRSALPRVVAPLLTPLVRLFPGRTLRYPGDDVFWMLLKRVDDHTDGGLVEAE